MKRGREDALTAEDGAAAAKAILELPTGDLFNECKWTALPYPGIGVPPSRPPVELQYVGSDFVFELVQLFGQRRRVLIEGPRGFGKSTDLRALSCVFYSDLALEQKRELVVSIWNMEAAVNDVVKIVQDALHFAFLVKWEGELAVEQRKAQIAKQEQDGIDEVEKTEAANSETEQDGLEEVSSLECERMKDGFEEIMPLAELQINSERKEVEELLQRIDSIDAAVTFVRSRQKDHGESFHFFADGWEILDVEDFQMRPVSRRLQRDHVQNQLEKLFLEGTSVWIAASAKSTIVKEMRKDTWIVTKSEPFSKVQYSVYAQMSILGKLEPLRGQDIDYYTGRVPWLLDVLTECCRSYAQQKNAKARMAVKEQVVVGGRCKLNLVKEKISQLSTVSEGEIADMLLYDDDEWAMVLQLFREHEVLQQVEEKIEAIQLAPYERCLGLREMGKKDRTYFRVEENCYCSGFIEWMYMEGFRVKEKQLGGGSDQLVADGVAD